MIKDNKMDNMIEDIIEIFKLDGVELVRLSGLVRRASNIAELNISPETLDNIIVKLKNNAIINFEYVTICPNCGEKSYQIKPISTNGKICDTCGVYFTLNDFTRNNA